MWFLLHNLVVDSSIILDTCLFYDIEFASYPLTLGWCIPVLHTLQVKSAGRIHTIAKCIDHIKYIVYCLSVFLHFQGYRKSYLLRYALFGLIDSYTSCCWISLSRYGNGNWLVSASVNLNRRSDNGRINSSPVSRSPAIVQWQEGCLQSLRIPVEDPDGDVVKCRWASLKESSINNDSFPYGTLDEVNILT